MKHIFSCFFFLCSFFTYSQIQHCGYDFTSYIVVNAHENGVVANPEDLKITVVSENGTAVINVNNMYSWNKGNEPMVFTQNYLVSKAGEKERYFFPYAKDNYFISVTNTFPAENFSIKVEDINGIYKTATIPLQSFNLYILCSTENQKAKMFGKRTNSPVEVILEKE
ncbi:hypothetical protein FIA58_019800 [Flavobacterium jejuense]|uniref:Uncharacterized protein n=1 Tax=Flavobacterium jejuense TaxID=1544455 RepID=A0ABX0IZF5_9FLAO|nr:hypothetical protein [Flavobacterium jejuense]NHN27928.1 hypothetical protein [Flavobacterium jejuense]